VGSHPANLGLRFPLELVGLYSLGLWGWRTGEGWLRWLLVLGLPLFAAAAWATFAVPDDPSRSGEAPIPVPGLLRLVLELGLFASAVLCLRGVSLAHWGTGLAFVVILHYVASYDRLVWLLRQ
jgi:Protein of unknown function (DUF2568)